MPTQAELDSAVIEAAEKHVDGCCGATEDAIFKAVRARRAAMRPHKAALLVAYRNHDSMSGKIMYSDMALETWNRLSERDKELRRMVLAEILAAPDEPTEDAR